MVSKAFNKGARLFQLFCTVMVLALTANFVAGSDGHSPAIIRFDLFVAVFAFLSLIYLILATFKETLQLGDTGVIATLLDLTNIVWFLCAAIATAALLGVHSCTNVGYLKDNRVVKGSTPLCREAQAATAFLFFGLFAFITSLVTGILDNGVNLRSHSAPSMSQISGGISSAV